jgi:hypothetical protein
VYYRGDVFLVEEFVVIIPNIGDEIFGVDVDGVPSSSVITSVWYSTYVAGGIWRFQRGFGLLCVSLLAPLLVR